MSDSETSNGSWLVSDGRVLATVEVAEGRAARRRGLLGRDGIEGAMLLSPARSVHTIGMRFPIDVVHLDAQRRVLAITTMKPNRLGRFVMRSRSILECEAGSVRRWGVSVGDELEIR